MSEIQRVFVHVVVTFAWSGRTHAMELARLCLVSPFPKIC